MRVGGTARSVAVTLAAGMLAACGSATATTGTFALAAACTSGAPGGVLGGACDTQTPARRVVGAGSSSVEVFYTRAFYFYGQANKAVSVDYSPAGSSVGITDIKQGTVDFGQTEIPMPAPAGGRGGPILQLPVELGGVAISYNLPGAGQGLRLDGPALAGIYTGAITRWDDPAIKALNPDLSPPHLAIVAVHRADSSGPGYDLDRYLISTAGAAWTARAGTKPTTRWPLSTIGVGQQLNTGVANYIALTPGAIGYLEYAFAQQSHFQNAALQNASGTFVAPSVDSIGEAGAQAAQLSDARFDIVNRSGGAYPLANFSWALLSQRQASTEAGIVLGKLFDWVTTTGQQNAAPLGYAPLPANAVAYAHQILLKLQTSSGADLFS